jgi:hypothetical protein
MRSRFTNLVSEVAPGGVTALAMTSGLAEAHGQEGEEAKTNANGLGEPRQATCLVQHMPVRCSSHPARRRLKLDAAEAKTPCDPDRIPFIGRKGS